MKTKPSVIKIDTSEYRLDLRGKAFANVLAVVSNGKKSLQFSTAAAADRKADEIATMLETHGKSRLESVSRILRDDINTLYAKLAPFNRTLEEAVDFYVGHLVRTKANESTETVTLLVDKWIDAKQTEFDKGTLRERTLQTIKFFGKKFKAQWSNRRIGTITKKEVKDWLASLNITEVDGKHTGKRAISTTYEKHHLSHLSQFFIWCNHNYLAMVNPCEGIDVKSETAEPTYFSVERATEFLKLTQDKHIELLPFHVIGLFAGVRPKECERLTWAEIDFDDNCIVMFKGNAKTRTGRRPEIHPTLAAWLKWYQLKCPNAPLIPADFKRRVNAFREEFGQWEHNVMRHSYASYYLSGIKKDFGHLEATLGNSRVILQKHYVQFPTKAEALKFWQLVPPLE